MFSTYFDATDWTQSISSQLSHQAWQRSRQQSTAWAQWNAYLNQLCLDHCLQSLKAETIPTAIGMNDRWADRTWALVNGSVISVGQTRIALMPSEAIDQSELEVPQEWIDIPSWAADYYLAVFITPDTQTLHIAGYATHRQIKQQGQLNLNTRSYHLDIEALTADLNLLWLTYDRQREQTRANILAPTELSAAQAENLIQRLGDRAELLPRLEVPFATWAALLSNPTWHEQLYQQRQGESTSSLITNLTRTNLNQWLQGQFDRVWQPVNQVLAPQQIAISTRSSSRETNNNNINTVNRAKVIEIGEGQVGLVVNLSTIDAPENPTEVRIELQVHPTGDSIHLPGETQVRLLTLEGDEIAQAKAAITETIRLQFRANLGEAFQVEITCNHQRAVEVFEL